MRKKWLCFVIKGLTLCFFFIASVLSGFCDTGTNERKERLRTIALADTGRNAAPVRAYEGIMLDDANLISLLNSTLNDETGDFKLVQLVRILYFAENHTERIMSEEMEETILEGLENLDYWLTYGEDQYCYWSENHMIMWMSSAYLMRQLKGWEMDETLDQRLNHYLDLKLQYGFYEFFSSTYQPFTLSGLLNLSDFAEDELLRSKAEEAAKILMKNLVMMVNDKGSFFPTAGRNYPSRYTGTSYNTWTYITTGLGPEPTGSSHIGGFLATTSMDLEGVAESWTDQLDTSYTYGHSFSDKLTVHAGLNRQDRTVFQWSAGGYFHPDCADDTVYTVEYYNLENNKHFNIFKDIPNFPDSWANGFSKIGATFSRGSDIAGSKIDIYKNSGIVLSSLDNYYGGYSGYQQWPWVATVDDIAVWTQSGEVKEDWGSREKLMQNTHLPWVGQEQNAALIVYNPNTEIRLAETINQMDTDVAVYWPEDRFDETLILDQWLLGRKGESYIAVLCDKLLKKNGHYYSDSDRGRQMWAVVVGNTSTHGSFSDFISMINQATYSEEYIWTFYEWRYVYKTSINVDGKSISKRW